MNNFYRNKIKYYYNKNSSYYYQYLGNTFQAGVLRENLIPVSSNVFEETVKYFANKISINTGDIILDAGCGLCGPAITIAKTYNHIKIHSITISEYQVSKSNELIYQNNLTDNITVDLMDYHNLNFRDQYFDKIIFFESFGYSDNPMLLLRECSRVLKHKGILFIKDVFVKEPNLTKEELDDLDNFNNTFVQLTPQMSDTVKMLVENGFEVLEKNNLTDVLSIDVFYNAMKTDVNGQSLISFMSENQHKTYKNLPVYFGEIIAKSK